MTCQIIRNLFSNKTIHATIWAYVFLFLILSPISCKMQMGDPVSESKAILHKSPARFSERVQALDAVIRRDQMGDIQPSLAMTKTFALHQTLLAKQISSDLSNPEKLKHLITFIYDSLNIEPVQTPDSLKYSLPSEVLIHRKGSCVGLAILVLVYAEMIDLPLNPVLLPEHITLALSSNTKDVPKLWLETLKPDSLRTEARYREIFSLDKRPAYTLQDQKPIIALYALILNWSHSLQSQSKNSMAVELAKWVNQEVQSWPDAEGTLAAMLWAQGKAEEARQKLTKSLQGDSLSQSGQQLKKALE